MYSNKKQNEPINILDSRLISTTYDIKDYNVKLVDCNEYIQVYLYQDVKIKKKKQKDFDLNLKKLKIDKIVNTSKTNNQIELSSEIEERNIIRSKLKCQRLAKANMQHWKTFITLTYAENLTDVKKANKEFNYFINKVRRVKKDFMYLCVTEFQKRGAVHYHLFTNIDVNDNTLIYSQKDKPIFKHIKYWNKGFTKVDKINDPKKVVGYISKYMTKDIDNRLFSKHRYFYSQNLNKPIDNYINTTKQKEFDFYIKKIQDKELLYQNEYINSYDNQKVIFLEFKNK